MTAVRPRRWTGRRSAIPNDARASRGERTFAAVAGLASAAMLVWALPQVGRTLEARGWDVVPGVITAQQASSELLYVEVGRYRNHETTEGRLRVDFAFTNDGQTFTGDRISPLRPWVMDSRAAREEYKVGRAVSVHVNPYAPVDSVIDVSFPWGAALWVLAACVGLGWAARVFAMPALRARLRRAISGQDA